MGEASRRRPDGDATSGLLPMMQCRPRLLLLAAASRTLNASGRVRAPSIMRAKAVPR